MIATVAEETTMPVLELTDEQVIELIRQLPEEKQKQALAILAQETPRRPRSKLGNAKNRIARSHDSAEPRDDPESPKGDNDAGAGTDG